MQGNQSLFDCGDGAPELPTDHDPTGQFATTLDSPRIGPGALIMAITAIGQFALLLAVLAGGSPLIGLIGGISLLACGIAAAGATSLGNLFGREQDPTANGP